MNRRISLWRCWTNNNSCSRDMDRSEHPIDKHEDSTRNKVAICTLRSFILHLYYDHPSYYLNLYYDQPSSPLSSYTLRSTISSLSSILTTVNFYAVIIHANIIFVVLLAAIVNTCDPTGNIFSLGFSSVE